jgi:hypothetical protein
LKVPLVLVALLAVLALGSWWGYRAVTAPLPKTQATCEPVTVGTELTPKWVTVRVYNGGTKSGLASTVANDLYKAGFPIPSFGNKDGYGQLTTTIVGSSADSPEVQLVAGFFPDAVVSPDGRADHTVDVIVSDGFAGFKADAPQSVPISSADGVLCLPDNAVTDAAKGQS